MGALALNPRLCPFLTLPGSHWPSVTFVGFLWSSIAFHGLPGLPWHPPEVQQTQPVQETLQGSGRGRGWKMGFLP